MSGFATKSRVRLVEARRPWQPELADKVGEVLESAPLAVRVAWPGERVSWHEIADLEPAA